MGVEARCSWKSEAYEARKKFEILLVSVFGSAICLLT
jgi:hypothetical protein